MTGDANLILGIDGRPAERGADKVKESLRGIKSEARSTVSEVKKTDGAFENLRKTSFNLAGAFAAIGGALAVKKILDASDAYKRLEGQLRLVTKSADEYRRVNDALFRISQQTRQSLDSTVQLYTKVARASDQLGVSQQQVLRFTELVNKSFIVSGAATAESAGATRQLSQALASGILRGDEFNSIMENAPRIQEALAKSLNVTKGQLRELSIDGQLSAKKVFGALLQQGAAIDREFAKIPQTIGQSLTQLDNAFLKIVGTSDAVASSTNTIAVVISALANNLDSLVTVLGTVSVVMAARLAPALLAAAGGFFRATQASIAYQVALARMAGVTAIASVRMAALSAAMGFFGGPIGLAITAIAAAMYLLSQRTTLAEKSAVKYDTAMEGLLNVTNRYNQASGNTKKLLAAERAERIQNIKSIIAESEAKVQQLKNELSSRRRSGGGKFSGITGGPTGLELAAAREIREFSAEIQRQKDGLDDLTTTVNTATTATDLLSTSTETAGEKAKEASKDVKELVQETGQVAQIFEDASTAITRSFTDMFRDMLDGGNGVKNFADRMFDVFKDMLANIATLAIANPIIIPIVTAVGGSLGLDSGSIGKVVGQLGGGGGSPISNITDLFSLLDSGSLSQTLLPSGVASVVDDIGNSLFGVGKAVTGPFTGAGGFTEGVSGGLSQSFNAGNAAGGFIGSTAASLAGFNGTGNAFADAGIGIAGAAIGQALIPVPILGAAIGSFAGQALGSLFGSKPSSKEQLAAVDLGTGQIVDLGGQTGKKFSQENQDRAISLAQIYAGVAGGAGDFGSGQFGVSSIINNREGVGFQYGLDRTTRFTFDSANQAVEGFANDLIARFPEKVSDSFEIAIANIDFGKGEEDLTKALEDIAFIGVFESLQSYTQPVTQLQSQLDVVNAEFDEMVETAQRLGLEEAKLNERRQSSINQIRQGANQGVYDSILGIVNPQQLSQQQERQRFLAQLREIESINGDVEAVYTLHRLNMLQIEQQYADQEAAVRQDTLQAQIDGAQRAAEAYEQLNQSLGESINQLRLGDLSTLSPQAKVDEARALFNTTLTAALAGDRTAAGNLSGAGNQLLELSQAYNSSNEIFASDFQLVQSGLRKTQQFAQEQVGLQQEIAENSSRQLTATLEQTEIFESGLAEISKGLMGRLAGNIDPFTGTSFNAAGRSLSEVTSTLGLTVGQIESTGRALLGNYTGPTGAGELSSLLSSGGLNDAFWQALQAQAQGFANGGYPMTGKPFIVGENAPEVMVQRNSAMVIPFEQNAAIFREIQESNTHLRATVSVLQEGMSQMVSESKRTAQNTGELAEAAQAANVRR